MTEYGRGPGSEPWHPDDPLYGDGGWDGQQAQAGPQSAYGGQPQQHYPEQQQYQQQYDQGNGGWNNGHQDAYIQQQYQQEYGDPGQQYPGQHQQQYPGQNQHQQYPGHDQQQYDQGNGVWNNGSHQQAQGPYTADPYQGQQQAMAYGGGQPDFYGTPDAYPPPEPPARRSAETTPAPAPTPEPEAEKQPVAGRTDWDPGPDRGEQAFFAGGGDDDEDDEAEGRTGRGERKGRGGTSGKSGKGGKKRRSGCACLVVVMVFGGGLAGVSYFGYQFFQSRYGEVPDYAGNGTNETVTITVEKGDFGSDIGRKLKAAGVVKSVDAFTAAQAGQRDSSVQAGVYLLKKEMSAASALAMMLNPKSQNNFTVIEGERNISIYKKIDNELGLKKGTTEDVAEKKWDSLGLPEWANDNEDIKDPLEGFLYPSTYPIAKGMKPEAVLKEMISLAKAKFEQFGLEGKAKSLNLESPLQVLTVASLVEAEGNNKKDYKKIARVVYNRLEPNNQETAGLLDFDSTVNYLRGESKLATGSVDSLRQIDDPYNTYKIKGLPPGPIDNPGQLAIEGALQPAKGDWYYFVSISEDETLFAVTNEEHNRNRRKYQEAQNAQ
ncbi:endolytic transglycosylase MltG [Streptomyces sp. NPDC012510]|uniref:endolytic transglycosylase MltG n=1 Tax=Streptomyces sp. NPDC012510 TaxID=3364838 RepID=UPI0036DFDE98